jgi:hypothetical protein
MDTHKNACPKPKDPELMVRAVSEGGVMQGEDPASND